MTNQLFSFGQDSYTFIDISSVFSYDLNMPTSISKHFFYLTFFYMFVFSFCQRVTSGCGLWVEVLLIDNMIQFCNLFLCFKHVCMTASELFLYLLLTIS